MLEIHYNNPKGFEGQSFFFFFLISFYLFMKKGGRGKGEGGRGKGEGERGNNLTIWN